MRMQKSCDLPLIATLHNKISARVKLCVNERIQENVRQLYGGIDVARFNAEEKR